MYGYKILLFASLVLPIFAVPLHSPTILQGYAVVERSDDPVGVTILPSLSTRSIEEVDKRKNRFNGDGFGPHKSLETRGGTRGGSGDGSEGSWVGRRSDDLETREEADDYEALVEEVDVDTSEELSDDLEDRGIPKHSGNGRRGPQRHGEGESKRGLSRSKNGGSRRGLQRPGKGGGGKRGLTPGRGGSM